MGSTMSSTEPPENPQYIPIKIKIKKGLNFEGLGLTKQLSRSCFEYANMIAIIEYNESKKDKGQTTKTAHDNAVEHMKMAFRKCINKYLQNSDTKVGGITDSNISGTTEPIGHTDTPIGHTNIAKTDKPINHTKPPNNNAKPPNNNAKEMPTINSIGISDNFMKKFYK